MSDTTIKIDAQGSLLFVWDDEVGNALRDIGQMKVARASHVEPTSDAQWEADLSPVDGPVLGPFDERQQALDAETAWLRENVLGV